MKANLYTWLGFIAIVVSILATLSAALNEVNTLVGSPGAYLNPSTQLMSYRIALFGIIILAFAIVNIMQGKK